MALFLKLITFRFWRQVAWVSAPSLLQSKEKLLQMPGRRACILVPKILGTLLMGVRGSVASCSMKQQLPYASCR